MRAHITDLTDFKQLVKIDLFHFLWVSFPLGGCKQK